MIEQLSEKQIYESPDELRGCDKGQHLKRSVALQPVHLKSPKVRVLVDQEELQKNFSLEVMRQNLLHLK